jgi:hypothetical protein
MLSPLPAAEALNRYFFECRAKLLDVAAILDRIDRGGGAKDARLEKIRQALEILQSKGDDRAERIQQVFSLAYEAGWEKPAHS